MFGRAEAQQNEELESPPWARWVNCRVQSIAEKLPPRSEIVSQITPYLPLAAQGAASVVGFSTGLASAQYVGALLGVSSASSPLISYPLGFAGVSLASLLAAQCSRTCERLQSGASWKEALDARRPVEDMAVDVLIGTSTFLLFGGRFNRVMPSDLWHKGSLASVERGSIKTNGPEYARGTHRTLLQRMFKSLGCHHCGSKAGSVVADHIPPTALLHRMEFKGMVQRFFPQCEACMYRQGPSVRHGIRELRLHNMSHLPKVVTGVLVGLGISNKQHDDKDRLPGQSWFGLAEGKDREARQTGMLASLASLSPAWLSRSHSEARHHDTDAPQRMMWARAQAEYRLRLAQLGRMTNKLKQQGQELQGRLRQRGISQPERERVRDSVAATQRLKQGYEAQMHRLRKMLSGPEPKA